MYTRKGFNGITALDYSRTSPGITAVGQDDGSITLFDILSPQSSPLEIRVGNKSCKSLSFNSQGLLAVGWDRTKNEDGVMIFNVNQYSKLSNQDITQPTFSFVPNESIVSTQFYNETNLLASSSKIIRDIDIRVSSPTFQIPSKTVHGITPDPFNHFSFAGFADDGTVAIYDRRKLSSTSSEPLLSFNKLLGDTTRNNNNSCFRYHPSRRGEFATSHGGELIRRWQTGVSPQGKLDSLFVASVQDVRTRYDRVISFDYANEGGMDAISLVCMRLTGSIFKMSVVEAQRSIDFNSFNDITFTGSLGTFIESVDETTMDKIEDLKITYTVGDEQVAQNNHEEVNFVDTEFEHDEDDEDEEEDEIGSSQHGDFYDASEVLSKDISVKMRRRAYMGYGMGCAKNVEIIDNLSTIDNNLFLRSTWRWLDISQTTAQSKLMSAGGLDLSYEGVLGIWKGVEGLLNQDRFNRRNVTPEVFKESIQEILKSRNTKSMIAVKTNKEAQRKLCIIVAGFYYSPEELNQVFNRLTSSGSHTKAAAWAVFFGDVSRAVQILSATKNNRLRLMATAISGYLVQRESDDDNLWKDQCRGLSNELEDPYLRAIFAYIADNDWWGVLDETSLPLRERVGVALRYLPDKELTSFLNKVASRYISTGELEGLILTGITPRGMDLMQSYVDRTSDIQTAALIASFGAPKYFKDERAESWVFYYRQLLNSWGMFAARAKFDVMRAQVSKRSTGEMSISVIGSQAQLQCVRCNKNIFKPDANKKPSTRDTSTKSHSVCPHCGAAFPKCAICLLPLGRPLPRDMSQYEREDETRMHEFKEWPSFCLTCNHGMHAGHAEAWFTKSVICPVPGCSCKCNSK